MIELIIVIIIIINDNNKNNNNTVPDTYSYIADTATTASAAANRAADNKTAKFQELAKTHQFAPIAIETRGGCNEKAVEFIFEVRRRITAVTKE